MSHLTFSLDPLPPFRLDLTSWVLRRRPVNSIDRFEDGLYSRVFCPGGRPTLVTLSQPESGGRVEVRVERAGEDEDLRSLLAATIRRTFGMDVDLSGFYEMARQEPKLAVLAQRFVGVKPSRFPTIFEALVVGIACQQLSLQVGILLLNRLAKACGPEIETPEGLRRGFPEPQDVLKLSADVLKGQGFSTRKAEYILNIARAIAEGELDAETIPSLPRQEALDSLLRLKGIGRWTAEYVLLRGAGDLSTFPGDDAGAKEKLRRWLAIDERLSYDAVQNLTSRWKPYPGFVYFHLLLDSLVREGYITQDGPGEDKSSVGR